MMIIDDQRPQEGVSESQEVSEDITSQADETDPELFYYYLQDGKPKVNVGRIVNKDALIKSIVKVYDSLPTEVAKGEFLALVCTAHRLPTSIINSNTVEECATLAADAAEKILAPVDISSNVEISSESDGVVAEGSLAGDTAAKSSEFDDDNGINAEDMVDNLN